MKSQIPNARMKSQIPNPKSQKTVHRALIGLLFLTMAVMSVSCAGKAGKQEKQEFAKVTRGDISAVIPSTGTVSPRNRLEIKPPVGGRVEKILVNEGDAVRKGQVLAWMSSSDRAALLDAARAKGPEELKHWEDVYLPAPVVAPLNGFIIVRTVQPGQTLAQSDDILVMADHLIVKAQVDETDLGKVRLGQGVSIILDAFPNFKINAVVEHIAYESQVVNNVTVYEVDILPVRVPPFFRSGMSATVNFEQSERKGVLLLPSNAVKKRGKNSYVFRIKEEGGKPEAIQVETGLEDAANTEIVSGLSLGDEVVIPTADMLSTLSPRRGGPQMMNPFGGGQRQGR